MLDTLSQANTCTASTCLSCQTEEENTYCWDESLLTHQETLRAIVGVGGGLNNDTDRQELSAGGVLQTSCQRDGVTWCRSLSQEPRKEGLVMCCHFYFSVNFELLLLLFKLVFCVCRLYLDACKQSLRRCILNN